MAAANRAYKYKRYMRDGSVQEITAVVRSRSEGKRRKVGKVREAHNSEQSSSLDRAL